MMRTTEEGTLGRTAVVTSATHTINGGRYMF